MCRDFHPLFFREEWVSKPPLLGGHHFPNKGPRSKGFATVKPVGLHHTPYSGALFRSFIFCNVFCTRITHAWVHHLIRFVFSGGMGFQTSFVGGSPLPQQGSDIRVVGGVQRFFCISSFFVPPHDTEWMIADVMSRSQTRTGWDSRCCSHICMASVLERSI